MLPFLEVRHAQMSRHMKILTISRSSQVSFSFIFPDSKFCRCGNTVSRLIDPVSRFIENQTRHAARQTFKRCREDSGLFHDPFSGGRSMLNAPGKRLVSCLDQIKAIGKFDFHHEPNSRAGFPPAIQTPPVSVFVVYHLVFIDRIDKALALDHFEDEAIADALRAASHAYDIAMGNIHRTVDTE
jgi:hypothetical protein